MTLPRARIGMDIGGTKIEAASLAGDGTVEATAKVPTVQGVEGVLSSAERALSLLSEQTGRSIADFSGIGAGVPGQVDQEAGTVANAYNMGVEFLALGPELTARTGLPATVENDVTAASLGAAHLLQLTGHVIYLNLGTGLAIGIVQDGKPWRGGKGYAGEVGHLPVDEAKRPCPCGQIGCLETAASGSALRRYWPQGGADPGRALYPAVLAGDESAAVEWEHLVRGAASTIRILAHTFDPDALVVGGGLRSIGDPLFDAIHARLASWAAESEFFDRLKISQRIQVLPEDSPAAAVGAAISGSLAQD